MQIAINLAVFKGVAFSAFDFPDMKMLTESAKGPLSDSSKTIVNSENVKTAVREFAKLRREETKKLLKRKVINLVADFATCERREFLGKFES